jgi:hypothetical protein
LAREIVSLTPPTSLVLFSSGPTWHSDHSWACGFCGFCSLLSRLQTNIFGRIVGQWRVGGAGSTSWCCNRPVCLAEMPVYHDRSFYDTVITQPLRLPNSPSLFFSWPIPRSVPLVVPHLPTFLNAIILARILLFPPWLLKELEPPTKGVETSILQAFSTTQGRVLYGLLFVEFNGRIVDP